MKLNSADLRRQCVVHRRREPCFICGGHETITEAHHVMPLKDVAFILDGGCLTMEEPPIEWLCPNCYAYTHAFYRGKLPWNAFTEEELRRVFAMDDYSNGYFRKQIKRWPDE